MLTIESAGWSQESIREALEVKSQALICNIVGHATWYRDVYKRYIKLYTKFGGWFHMRGREQWVTDTELILPRKDTSVALKSKVIADTGKKGVRFILNITAVKTDYGCGYYYKIDWSEDDGCRK